MHSSDPCLQVVLAHDQWDWSWEAVDGKGCRLQLLGPTQFLQPWGFHPLSQVFLQLFDLIKADCFNVISGAMERSRILRYRIRETSTICTAEKNSLRSPSWCSTTWKTKDNWRRRMEKLSSSSFHWIAQIRRQKGECAIFACLICYKAGQRECTLQK